MKPDQSAKPPQYTDRERYIDGIVHVIGVVSSIVAVAVMIVLSLMWQDVQATLSVTIYGVSAATVFVTSAAYHHAQTSESKAIWRRLDHSAIFVKIAGTYTPFAMISIGGWFGLKLLLTVWGVAVVGVTVKLAGWRFGNKLSAGLYLAQGWLILLALDPFRKALEPAEMILCLFGGGLYTIGVGFFLAARLPHHNAIWHVFVLAASACFYAAIFKAVVLR